MSFPAEFSFSNEDHFTRSFVVPLLQRLGYSLVVNYHGAREFGKDLVFGEIDSFGHVCYHAMQVKYEASISLSGSQELIEDCHQAFANTFMHPQTGEAQHISTFYVVNGGSLSDQAVTQYFASLLPRYHGNVRLLQGKDLLQLDRWAAVNTNGLQATVNGLLLELHFNLKMLSAIGDPVTNTHELARLRLVATGSFLAAPPLAMIGIAEAVDDYFHFSASFNSIFDLTQLPIGPQSENRQALRMQLRDVIIPTIKHRGSAIELAARHAIASLGPFVAL